MSDVNKAHLRQKVLDQLAQIPKALASPRRLELVELLAQAEKTVDTLAREACQSVANTSQHLQILRRAGLVNVRREGSFAHYSLASEQVLDLWQVIRALGESQLSDMDRLLRDLRTAPDELELVSISELRSRLSQGDVLILDVRPDVEYAAGHIPGALSIPVGELPDRLAELPEDAHIVAYCRGPYCVLADEAVALLRQQGLLANRLETGFPDWRTAGLPVAGGQA